MENVTNRIDREGTTVFPSTKTALWPYLGFLDDIGKLPAPQVAVFGRDEEEAVPAVKRSGRRLYQTHLDVPPACGQRHPKRP